MQYTDAKDVRACGMHASPSPSKCHGVSMSCTSEEKFEDTMSYEVTPVGYTSVLT